MKLRDLAKSSYNPTSFLPGLRIFLSRFRNRETARFSRESYESVFKSSSAPHLLTLLQQTTMVPVLRVLYRPRNPRSPVTISIRSYHGDRNFPPRTYYKPASFCTFLTSEQNQRAVYREVLIAGDLSQEDVNRATAQLGAFQVSREQTDPSPPGLTLYPGLCPNMDPAPVW